ncbi:MULTISPECIES: hypothetical protein, partial [unclassified Methylobacterium]|uniref:hypothetical protein n=1 Tax=unclassified Methylobacterium TaxID=2615210 RepID=UPI001AEE7FC3
MPGIAPDPALPPARNLEWFAVSCTLGVNRARHPERQEGRTPDGGGNMNEIVKPDSLIVAEAESLTETFFGGC